MATRVEITEATHQHAICDLAAAERVLMRQVRKTTDAAERKRLRRLITDIALVRMSMSKEASHDRA